MAHLQQRKLRVSKRRYTKEFREFAVERLRGCENIVALARELQVSRRQLYRWRDELDPEIPGMEAPGQDARASTPVSYTHLDVYKRQDHHRLIHFTADRSNDFRVSEIELRLFEQRALLLDIRNQSPHAGFGR